MQDAAMKLLLSLAEARDITDVNIAAGIALEEIRKRTMLPKKDLLELQSYQSELVLDSPKGVKNFLVLGHWRVVAMKNPGS